MHENNFYYLLNKATKFEKECKWKEALQVRKQLGQETDIKVIELIIEAIDKGDRYRALVNELIYSQPNLSYSEITKIAYNTIYYKQGVIKDETT